jgi:hypothetical protein
MRLLRDGEHNQAVEYVPVQNDEHFVVLVLKKCCGEKKKKMLKETLNLQ